MHEVALVSAALNRAVREAQAVCARRIERLTFAVASDSHISAESVVMLAAALGRGSLAEGADVRVDIDDAAAGSAELTLTSIDVELIAPPGADSGA